MSDIAVTPSIVGDQLYHTAMEAKKSLVAPAGGSAAGMGANINYGSGRGQSLVPEALFRPLPKADPNAHAGPPPAFQVSLLELDMPLRDTLARMNAAHARDRNADAVAIPEVVHSDAVSDQSASSLAEGGKLDAAIQSKTDHVI